MPRVKILCQFGVSDIAELCGCTDSAIFHQIRRGNLDIEDLVSVTKFLAAKAKDDIRMEIGYAYGRCGSYGPPLARGGKKEAQEKASKKETKKKKKITRVQG